MSKSVVSTDWGNADPNCAYYLAGFSGSAVKVEGPPGGGKTTSAVAFLTKQGYKTEVIIASAHAPEDFSGIPYPEPGNQFFTSTPARFIYAGTQPKTAWFWDEITTPPPSVRAPIMSLISERRCGSLQMHKDLLIYGACNPPEQCPNGSPFEPALANRWGHFTWHHSMSTWEAGMTSGGEKYDTAWVPTVPSDWRRWCDAVGHQIVAYCRRNPSHRNIVPDGDAGAYPTLRTWHYLRNALAVARSVAAPKAIESEMTAAYVGTECASTFMQFLATLDLVDPEDVLANPSIFKFDKRRVDLALALMASVTTAVATNYSGERFTNACRLVCEIVGGSSKELGLSQLRHLLNARPESEPAPAEAKAIVRNFGDAVRLVTSK